ncbi:MAG: ABC transporter ATP-binding protein [Pseudomonadota bacterium]
MTDAGFISIRNVSMDYGPVRACNDISLDIRRGEFFALLGPSGCGKTTLLRLLAGFISPTEGEIFIDGQPVAGMPPYRRPVNMVFQNYAIFPHLDVRQNIAFGLRKERLPKAELDRRVEEVLELIKLPGYGHRGANELSGGQRQRVALARALIKRPKVLLLDEPLGALDKKLREKMQVELRQLQKTVGITFVFVTHDQEEALTLSDRIAVMKDGKVLEVETPGVLYESPKTLFCADFLGTMNFFEGVVRGRENDRVVVESPELGRVLAGDPGLKVAPGSAITIALRPEKIRLAPARPADPVNVVEGRIGPSTYLGDRSHYFIHLPRREAPVAVAVQNLDRSLADATGGQERVWLTWSPGATVLLPAERPAEG